MTDEELDHALRPRPRPTAPWPQQDWQAELLWRTEQQLPRPRRWPKVAAALGWVSLGIVIGAGGLSWLRPPATTTPPPEVGSGLQAEPPQAEPPQAEPTQAEPALGPFHPTSPSERPSYSAPLDPDQLELEAELPERPRAAELYRQLGDYYFERDDIRSASRCYRLHLNHLTPDQMVIRDGDSWYLNALKFMRRQEN